MCRKDLAVGCAASRRSHCFAGRNSYLKYFEMCLLRLTYGAGRADRAAGSVWERIWERTCRLMSMVTIWCRECLRAGILIPSAWYGPESIMLGTVEGREVRHSNLRWLHTGGAAQGLTAAG